MYNIYTRYRFFSPESRRREMDQRALLRISPSRFSLGGGKKGEEEDDGTEMEGENQPMSTRARERGECSAKNRAASAMPGTNLQARKNAEDTYESTESSVSADVHARSEDTRRPAARNLRASALRRASRSLDWPGSRSLPHHWSRAARIILSSEMRERDTADMPRERCRYLRLRAPYQVSMRLIPILIIRENLWIFSGILSLFYFRSELLRLS